MKALWKPLFGSPLNVVLTAGMLALFYLTVPPFLHWALANATWDGLSRKACAPDGACWAFVTARFPLFIYGRYPQPERWRVDLAFMLLVLISAGTLFAPRRRGWWLLRAAGVHADRGHRIAGRRGVRCSRRSRPVTGAA